MMKPNTPSRRWPTFITVWLGQLVSLFGSGLTTFALGLWVFERTGLVTPFALTGLFAILPGILLSPLAGALVDRWDRRRVMILSDTGAGLSTLAMALLFFSGRIEVWHVCLGVATSSAFGAFQWPAYAATTTLLVPKKHLGQANGLVQLSRAIAEILAPATAGVLILTIGMQGVLLIDVATFLFAVITLLFVRFPRPEPAAAEAGGGGPLWRQALHGFGHVVAQPGLLGLLVFFAIVNYLWGTVGAVIVPMILGFTTKDVLGAIISAAGAGMLIGSLVMSAWGGPKRRIHGVLLFEILSGLCFILMGLKPWAWLVGLGAVGAHLTIAIINGSNQAIWQAKVPPAVQGRVFATQHMVASSTRPLAYLLAGPLVDQVFEPLLAPEGPLAGSLGQVIGTGAGRGIGLLFVIMGIVKMTVSLAGTLYPRLRRVEDEIPDAFPE